MTTNIVTKELVLILLVIFFSNLTIASQPFTRIVCAYSSSSSGATGHSSGPEGSDVSVLALEACEDIAANAGGHAPRLQNGQCKYNTPNGFTITPSGGCDVETVCFIDGEYEAVDPNSFCGNPDQADKNHGSGGGEICVGNPCNAATGNKLQSESDFSIAGLSFSRSYNSLNLAEIGLGKGWRHSHQRKLIVNGDSLTQVSGSGRGEPWQKINGVWQGDADSDVVISESENGFQLLKPNGVIESYSSAGQIMSVTDTNGSQTTYSYDGHGFLTQASNQYGQLITFTYSNGRLIKVTDALNAEYIYEYDSNNNLERVIFPDETPSDSTDNPRKIYHYDNPSFPSHLTGITDENGDRYATWAYNAEGKAISSEHSQTTNAVGQEKVELDFQAEQQ